MERMRTKSEDHSENISTHLKLSKKLSNIEERTFSPEECTTKNQKILPTIAPKKFVSVKPLNSPQQEKDHFFLTGLLQLAERPQLNYNKRRSVDKVKSQARTQRLAQKSPRDKNIARQWLQQQERVSSGASMDRSRKIKTISMYKESRAKRNRISQTHAV